MIVVDLEFSGLDLIRCGIFQIGAIELENPKNQFFGECRIDDEDIIEKEALKITGTTEAKLRDKNKQSQKQLLEKFFKWCRKTKIKNFVCENPQWDVAFLMIKAKKYGLEFPMHYRAFDLHSIAQARYMRLKKKLLIKKGYSEMGLTNILKFCGMHDERIAIQNGKIVKKGKPHNALEDAKLEAECFSRLLYGKVLLDEYKKFPVPEYLKCQKQKK